MTMTQDLYEQVKIEIERIPISYYTKNNNITLALDDKSQTSYIDLSTFEIKIALNNIADGLKSVATIDALSLNRLIRGLVYHEVGHALLTNIMLDDAVKTALTYLFSFNIKLIDLPNDTNIIEDFKNEDFLKNAFLNTDFVENRRLILGAPLTDDKIKSFEGFIFNELRLKDTHSNEIQYLINSFLDGVKTLNANGELYYRYDEIKTYADFIINLYRIYERDYLKKQNNKSESNGDDANDDNTTDGEQSANGDGSQGQEQQQEQQQDGDNEQNQDGDNATDNNSADVNGKQDGEPNNEQATIKAREVSEDDAREIIKNAIKDLQSNTDANANLLTNEIYTSNKQFKNKVINILSKAGAFGIGDAYQEGDYYGAFSKDLYIRDLKRQEPQYNRFKNSNEGDTKTQATKERKILIVLDNSGSYYDNDDATNEILKALCEIEKSINFKFDLVTFNDYLFIKENDKRLSRSGGCSDGLNYDTLKVTDDYNAIIMLTDGDIRINQKNTKILNRDIVYIISDKSNYYLFERTLPKAHKTYINRDYAKYLNKTLVKVFEKIYL